MNDHLPPLASIKAAATLLRSQHLAAGTPIAHSRALELVAHSYGYRDWNTLSSVLVQTAAPVWRIGARVHGHYLGQAFVATVLEVKDQGAGWACLALDLDQAVDVVTFDSFSSMRKRVNGVIGPKGVSAEKTSNGLPQLQVRLGEPPQ
jgi:hypothetical protein